MIKKTASMLFCVLFSLVIFSGCQKTDNSAIVGEWVPTTASLNGETVQYAELGIEQDQFGFIFDNNGKCTVTLAGITGKGTYVFNETSVDVNINDQTHKLDYQNGTLSLTLNYSDSEAKFTFTKVNENIK